jgi:hypothetical protein
VYSPAGGRVPRCRLLVPRHRRKRELRRRPFESANEGLLIELRLATDITSRHFDVADLSIRECWVASESPEGLPLWHVGMMLNFAIGTTVTTKMAYMRMTRAKA